MSKAFCDLSAAGWFRAETGDVRPFASLEDGGKAMEIEKLFPNHQSIGNIRNYINVQMAVAPPDQVSVELGCAHHVQ